MLKERDHLLIEDALFDTVHYSKDPATGRPLSVREIATDINVPAGQLQDAADQRRPQPPHMQWIVPLIKRTQNYALVRFICRAVGGVFIKLPEATKGTVGLVAVIGDVMKEVAEVVKVASDAITDNGRVDAREKADLLQQITEAEGALAAAKQLVKELAVEDCAPAPRKVSRR